MGALKHTRTVYATGLFVIISFIVKGPIQPKGRPRLGRHGVYTPRETKSAEEAIGYLAKAAMRGRPPIEGLCGLKIEILIETLSRKKLGTYATSRCDWDNQAKLLGDAANGIIWKDDRQIAKCEYTRKYGSETLARITVEELA